MATYKILPTNFRELQNGKVLLSNLANHYQVLNNKKELQECFIHESSQDIDLLNKLEQKLFISSPKDFESKVLLTASALAKNINRDLKSHRLIMIVPTLRCDHHCSYCQVSRVNSDLKGYDLEIESIPNIIRWILKVERAPYKIEFQGGEPLLAFDFIRDFYEKFSESVGIDNFSIVITSSLSLLNKDIINWCKNKPVEFSTSIDAGIKAHNKHRKLITKDSFQLVQRNIQSITQNLGPNRVGTVSTITREGLNGYDELVDTHIALGLGGMFVRPVSPFGFAEGKQVNDISVPDFMNFYRKLIKRVLSENVNGYKLVEYFLLIHYKRILNNPNSAYVDLMAPAGYLKNTLLFDYTGNIFGSDEARMVYRKYGNDSLILGHVNDENLDLTSSIHLLSESFNFDVPGCSDCVYQGSCGSDPVYHLQHYGEPIGLKGSSRFCELHKSIFDFIFELLESKEVKKILDRWLCE
ncbi:His-Xaa-Ser system radical SAM maturase HxsB [Alteromonas sp. LMIT006]|uniref:His-Xaa-Ser system radical SAM maturase HxsB n=1 Tax=Alteromonadaceae TaxID=72275 RepID=UPI0020CA5517|nr:His-Xaa-Ser system radical SAM maturase HxsB [Alteromonas sp. LMIT006]UTP72755.1 His-Xaa-Ser system radical SAM maturase HxsB [Alteromonas sp. LMIT006]